MSDYATHPVYKLPVSQAAYVAEMLTLELAKKEDLYDKFIGLFPEVPMSQFCVTLQHVKGQLKTKRLAINNHNDLDQLNRNLAQERIRVGHAMKRGKHGIIELKKLYKEKEGKDE